MVIVSVILLVLFVITAFLLMIFVLIQDEQGEGLGGIFGGGSSTPFGSRSGNILTKITSVLGIIFIIAALGLAWVNRTSESGDVIGAAHRQDTGKEKGLDWWENREKSRNGSSHRSGDRNDSPATGQIVTVERERW